ncbi:MAG TPA: hypothetical protein VK460_05760 [Burkholderiales bacterium]|nr:hypothetical protein [Burkholderiales bacterium]
MVTELVSQIVPNISFSTRPLEIKYYLALTLILLSGCASTSEPLPGKTTTFGPPSVETAVTETPPAESATPEATPAEATATKTTSAETAIAVKWKSYDEVWDALVAAVLRRHLLIVKQDKERGVITAKEESAASENGVEVYIDPTRNSHAYYVILDSVNPGYHASKSQRQDIADEIKQSLQDNGTIGLVSARLNPSVDVDEIAEGSGHTALGGAAAGMTKGAKPGEYVAVAGVKGNNPYVVGFGLTLSAAGAVVGGLVGSVAGAFEGDSAQTIEEKKKEAKAALTTINVQEKVQDDIEQDAKEHGGLKFVAFPNEGPTSLDQKVSYRDLSAKKVDVVLEITVTGYGIKRVLVRGESAAAEVVVWRHIVFINARARIIRTKTGSVLEDKLFAHKSSAKSYSEWGANNGQPLAEELTSGCQDIARRVSEFLYSD